MRPKTVLRQSGGSLESRAATAGAMLMDLEVKACSSEELGPWRKGLTDGSVLPVGSVEFVHEAMREGGIAVPPADYYPAELTDMLGRQVRLMDVSEIQGRCFVKPERLKLFNGFVFDSDASESSLSEYDRVQLNALRGLEAGERVWASEEVRFVSEWRNYVLRGELIGSARYDEDGVEEAPEQDIGTVRKCIELLRRSRGGDITCAVDAGVLEDGRTVLVELTDAYALGLYRCEVSSRQYLEMLIERWGQLRA